MFIIVISPLVSSSVSEALLYMELARETLAPPTTSCRGRGLLAKLNSTKFLSQYKALAFGENFLLQNVYGNLPFPLYDCCRLKKVEVDVVRVWYSWRSS